VPCGWIAHERTPTTRRERRANKKACSILRLVSAINTGPMPWFWGINGGAGVLAATLQATSVLPFLHGPPRAVNGHSITRSRDPVSIDKRVRAKFVTNFPK
jgi:hypothetical protein